MSSGSNSSGPIVSRREVLGAGAGVVSLVVVGCAGKLPPAQAVTPAGGEVTIALADAPELAQAGGIKVLKVEGVKKPIAVVRGEGDQYVALLLKCTHMGCTPGWDAQQHGFACPCHGSRFDAAGQVVKGPAKAPLERYEVTADATTLRFRVA